MIDILKFYYVIILCKTTNWPNEAISDHQDAKNSKIPNIFTKIAPS